MQGSAWHTLFSIIVLISWSTAYAVEPPVITKAFQPTQALFANPERGWITHRFSDDLWSIETIRNSAEKLSLVLIKIDLSNYVNSTHIGQTKLNEIRAALSRCKALGLKAVLRSAYEWEGRLAPEPKSIDTLRTHVMDMKPIYTEYAHIIIAVEMGMFGPWGEMHSSYYSTVNTQLYYPVKTDAVRQVLNAYMLALPTTHSVLVRRPYYIRQVFNSSQPLTAGEAYGDSAKARVGYHNDAYLADATDSGTFGPGWTRAQELAYINQLTRYTIFGGESFGTPNSAYNNFNNAALESKQQHMTYLHRDYDPAIYNAWGTAGKENFTRRLGYRFELKSLTYSKEVAPGGILSFSLKLQNTGFSAMHRVRPVNLILKKSNSNNALHKYQTTLRVSPRSWTPEAGMISIDLKLRIPVSSSEGVWQLFLSMPDSNAQLQTDVRYAIRLANENVWNTDGTNLLVDNISITTSATGSRTNGTVFAEI